MIFFYIKLAFKFLRSDVARRFFFSLVSTMFAPRFREGKIKIFGKSWIYNDSLSFLIMFDEIFVRQMYKFSAQHEEPRILDCGANIGLSVLFFSKLYPEAKIFAFEPDPKIYTILAQNCQRFALKNVILIQKAVWHQETILTFQADHAAGGTLITQSNSQNAIQVQTTSLHAYLEEKIDFLKIDIEGAENEVIKSHSKQLQNVNNAFVEWHSFDSETQDLSQILTSLKQAGFRYYLEHNGSYSSQPFMKHNHNINNMDNCVNIFAYK